MNTITDHALVPARIPAGELSMRGKYPQRPMFLNWCDDLNARCGAGEISTRTAEGYRARAEEWLRS